MEEEEIIYYFIDLSCYLLSDRVAMSRSFLFDSLGSRVSLLRGFNWQNIFVMYDVWSHNGFCAILWLMYIICIKQKHPPPPYRLDGEAGNKGVMALLRRGLCPEVDCDGLRWLTNWIKYSWQTSMPKYFT